jgi:hypothetical protein
LTSIDLATSTNPVGFVVALEPRPTRGTIAFFVAADTRTAYSFGMRVLLGAYAVLVAGLCVLLLALHVSAVTALVATVLAFALPIGFFCLIVAALNNWNSTGP